MIDLDNIDPYLLRPVGFVRSKLKRREDCPKQGCEGAPDAWVEIEPAFAEGLDGITPGFEVVLITWFHKATCNILKLHPRNDPENSLQGVAKGGSSSNFLPPSRTFSPMLLPGDFFLGFTCSEGVAKTAARCFSFLWPPSSSS